MKTYIAPLTLMTYVAPHQDLAIAVLNCVESLRLEFCCQKILDISDSIYCVNSWLNKLAINLYE